MKKLSVKKLRYKSIIFVNFVKRRLGFCCNDIDMIEAMLTIAKGELDDFIESHSTVESVDGEDRVIVNIPNSSIAKTYGMLKKRVNDLEIRLEDAKNK